jgi:hypothetical protein
MPATAEPTIMGRRFNKRGSDMTTEGAKRPSRVIRAVIWSAGAIALTYLITLHRPHLLGWIPYLVILACPLMHLFMHRRHHAKSMGGDRSDEDSKHEH